MVQDERQSVPVMLADDQQWVVRMRGSDHHKVARKNAQLRNLVWCPVHSPHSPTSHEKGPRRTHRRAHALARANAPVRCFPGPVYQSTHTLPVAATDSSMTVLKRIAQAAGIVLFVPLYLACVFAVVAIMLVTGEEPTTRPRGR